ncbi:hypothetical protein DIS18_01975 [Algibacter marinivivus]|uniref:Uncharacterized protein n=1 Tax=Algibacter marinivivus TaxID=2100723 RepID=A0A2U2X6G0_9FLAO|nr:hypothetical protein [Algibacter marinivivus]PWH83344.1 hypothetical protein DIS18_01975 [Algibacter marinivivus]
MKKIAYLLLVIIINSTNCFAQVGIGTTTPHSSTILHIESSDKGFLPPHVSLTGVTDTSTITSPAEGLMVYSPLSNDCNLEPGIYVFNGTLWKKISGGTSYSRLIRDHIGVGNVTFTAYSSTNSYAPYSSLFDNVDNTGAATFHSQRSGSPTGDWGFGITLPNKYTITQLILDGRNDCCTARIVNLVARFYSCGNLVYSTSAISSAVTGDNIISIPNVYADEIRLVVPNGASTGSGAVINFSELDVIGSN